MTKPNIIQFVTDPQMLGLSISPAQTTCLKSIYGMPLTKAELALFQQCTGRRTPSPVGYPEATIISGARGGKDSRIAAPTVLFEAIFGQHDQTASKGETPVVALVAQDTKAAGIAFGYIKGYLLKSPLLKSMLAGEPLAMSLRLTNGVVIQCFPSTSTSMRGYSICTAILDEVAYFPLEGQADSDVQIQDSIFRGMINFDHTKLLKISTPWMKSGVLFQDYESSYGKDDPDLFVWQASSQLMNPSLRTSVLDRMRRRNPAMAAREFDAIFTDDLQAFLPQPWIDAAVMKNRFGTAPNPQFSYLGAIDPTSAGSDTFTLAIGHAEQHGEDLVVIQDYLKGWTRPRSGTLNLEETVVREIAQVCREYGVTMLISDRHAKGWVQQAFARHGIEVISDDDTYDGITVPDKSACYQELELALSQGRVKILDHGDTIRQLKLLEKSARPGGKVVIDHPRNTHDDFSNVLALLVHTILEACAQPVEDPSQEISMEERMDILRAFNGAFSFDDDNAMLGDVWSRFRNF